jgi:chorismate lyase / 3-hydroxybenzoate synthase
VKQLAIDDRGLAALAPPLRPDVPLWVTRALVNPRSHTPADHVPPVSSDTLTLLTIRVPDAERLNVPDLCDATANAYARLGEALGRTGLSAIRIWNYLPDPNQRMGVALDRYMVFNEGRNLGYRRWFGNADEAAVPATGTAVGIQSGELVVHCLASSEPGRPIENPRQISSWRYSERYGPTPPRFSRATVATIGTRSSILIGGTASIVGEDTLHVGDLAGQTNETFRNLAALIAAACEDDDQDIALNRLEDARVYVTTPDHAEAVRGLLAGRCPHLQQVEFATARLCRPELLVEIEGVAGFSPRE